MSLEGLSYIKLEINKNSLMVQWSGLYVFTSEDTCSSGQETGILWTCGMAKKKKKETKLKINNKYISKNFQIFKILKTRLP